MKTLYIILILPFLFSCEKEDNECKCTGKYTTNGQTYFYVQNVLVDCETKRPLMPLTTMPDAFFIKCE